MTTKGHQIKAPILSYLFLVLIICVTTPIKGEESRKLDEATTGSEKCTPCEGGNTPSQPPPTPTIEYFSPPPPSPSPPPPSPSPPPPEYVYSSPPPPSPKKPPSKNCPPPPSSSAYLYMTGPPGNLYPVNENFSGASPNHHHSFGVFLPLLVGVLGMMMAFW